MYEGDLTRTPVCFSLLASYSENSLHSHTTQIWYFIVYLNNDFNACEWLNFRVRRIYLIKWLNTNRIWTVKLWCCPQTNSTLRESTALGKFLRMATKMETIFVKKLIEEENATQTMKTPTGTVGIPSWLLLITDMSEFSIISYRSRDGGNIEIVRCLLDH